MRYIPATIAVIVGIDQFTKSVAPVNSGDSAAGVIGNSGALAGVLPLEGVPLLLVSIAALVGLTHMGVQLVGRGYVHPIIVGLLAGGAVGNIIDRMVFGHVRDFIWTPWLVFNLADVALLAGAIGFVACALVRGPSRSGVPSAGPVQTLTRSTDFR